LPGAVRGRNLTTMTPVCAHLDQVRDVKPRTPDGCEECLKSEGWWVHLRLCLACGHVGCCDSSPNRHARSHAKGSGHAIVQSLEPGEDWRYCFVDDMEV
jgi:uncharacterized UBP type Zn finger protein